MKTFRATKAAGFTLVEIMIVVLIIGILLAIAIPNFVAAREAGRAKSCVANLKQIDSAKQQSAMDNRLGAAAPDTFVITGVAADNTGAVHQLVGSNFYLRSIPVCPSGGNGAPYYLGTITQSPYCGVSASPAGVATLAGTTGATANYGLGEKWYHGLPQ